MPYGDGTGPNGMGPQTGRAAGFCSGYDTPGAQNPAVGRGFGRGRGGFGGGGNGRGGGGNGRGRRNRFFATGLPGWMRFGWFGAAPDAVQAAPPMQQAGGEINALRAQAQQLETMLKSIQDRITNLTTSESSDQG